MKNTWPPSVREPAFQADAPRQTVSLTINSDLFGRIKALGINASRVAEEALAQELERHRRAEIESEVLAGLAAANAYIQRHGSFADHMREYLGEKLEDPG